MSHHSSLSTNEQHKILVLFAHPAQAKSEVNTPLFSAAKKHPHITAIDLYAEYPDYRIDINKEQQRLKDHDTVIFLFPLYWYSTPSILKEWQDLVLEYGFAYGSEGKELNGKQFLCALSAGGIEQAYHADGFNHFTIRELLQPLEQMASLTGMQYLPPFALFGARTAAEEGRIEQHVNDWQTLLDLLAGNQLPIKDLKQLNTINSYLKDVNQ